MRISPTFLAPLALAAALHAAPAPAVAAPSAPAPTTYHYYGDAEFSLPDGQTLPMLGRYLVTRTTDPANNRITEISIVVDGKTGIPKEHEVVLVVTIVDDAHATYVMEDPRKELPGFKGSGTLKGKPWAWESWNSDAMMPGGVHVTSQCNLVPAPAPPDAAAAPPPPDIKAIKRVMQIYKPDGSLQGTSKETFIPISNGDWEARHAKMEAKMAEADKPKEAPPAGPSAEPKK